MCLLVSGCLGCGSTGEIYSTTGQQGGISVAGHGAPDKHLLYRTQVLGEQTQHVGQEKAHPTQKPKGQAIRSLPGPYTSQPAAQRLPPHVAEWRKLAPLKTDTEKMCQWNVLSKCLEMYFWEYVLFSQNSTIHPGLRM